MPISASPSVNYTPSPTKVPTPQNFLDFASFSYARNEMPQFLSKRINQVYGNQRLDDFIEKKGLKMATASDQTIWQEENRLTQIADGVTRAGNVFTSNNHTFRPDEIVTVWDTVAGNVLFKGRITTTTTNTFTALSSGTTWGTLPTTGLTCHTGYSEYNKGTLGQQQSLNTTYRQYSVQPTIVKEMVAENRSNLAQISWVEAPMADGSTGNLWFDINKEGCEDRFRNAREHSHFNSEKWVGDLLAAGYPGKEGILSAMEQGNIYSGLVSTLTDARGINDRLDAQGCLSDNTIYANSTLCYSFDTFLAAQNINAQAFGSFDNAENMELNLSFTGYSLGSYNFNYQGLRILNDPLGHGKRVGPTKVNGFLFPNASQTVRDSLTGKSAPRPMLHVLYRAKGAMNRDYEMVIRDWAQGTSLKDDYTVEFQSEMATALIGRNNTILFKAA